MLSSVDTASINEGLITSYLFTISLVVLLGVVVWSLIQTYNHNPPAHFIRVWGQLILFYLAPTMPWWALLVVALAFNSILSIFTAAILLILIGVYFYSSYVTPRQIAIHHNDIFIDSDLGGVSERPRKIAAIANLRLGLFSQPNQFLKLVDTVNQLDVDAVIIIGEWLYNPPADLVGNLMLLKGVNTPIYAIQGEHDHRYYPENADQFLHEDDLNHVFDSLGITEVVGLTPTNFGIPLIANVPQSDNDLLRQTQNKTGILLTNVLTNTSESDLAVRATAKVVLAPDESEVSKALKIKEHKTPDNLNLESDTSIQIIPSFGQRGVPFRLSKPSVSVFHINSK